MSDDTPTLAEGLAYVDRVILRTVSTDLAEAWQRIARVVRAADAYVTAPISDYAALRSELAAAVRGDVEAGEEATCGNRAEGIQLRPGWAAPVYVCDLPAGHLDEPHNNDWHQQAGGPMWRRNTRGGEEFA